MRSQNLPHAPSNGASLALLLAAIFAGCSGNFEAPLAESVGLPPSLTSAAETVVLRLTNTQAEELAVQVQTLSSTDARQTLVVPGEVVPSPEAYAVVSAPIAGRIVRVLAHEGEAVSRGQTVAVLESLEFATLVARAVEAQAEVALNKSSVNRYEQLVSEGIAPRARLEMSTAALTRSEATLRAVRAQLSALGVSEEGMRSLAQSSRPQLAIRAPISGLIQVHGIDLGQAVSAYDEMLTIVGDEEVMIKGLASPQQAAAIAPGDRVTITPATGTPDELRAVEASVTSVSPAVDAAARAVIVYIRTAPNGLRPGDPVRVTVETSHISATLLAPVSALTYDGESAVLFIQTAPNTYERREVVVGEPREGFVPVLAGAIQGERVAVSNAYDLKALIRFEQYGEE